MRLILLLLGLALGAGSAHGAVDPYTFDDSVTEIRYRSLIEELRCPKCQNQNIADSNAPLAQDLRQRVYEMLNRGHSDKEIIDFLVARYGDFVTYRPPLRSDTLLLWFGPFTAMVFAVLGLAVWIRRRASAPPPELSAAERERLARLTGMNRRGPA